MPTPITPAPTPRPAFADNTIELAQGGGGKATRRLIEGLIAPALGVSTLTDSALLGLGGADLAFTADSFVVQPLRFPGGSIGSLAVHGTVNDLAVAGARPVALTCCAILEAGLPVETLSGVLADVRAAADRAGVSVVGGDTKVVEHGRADGLYLTTAGIGLRDPRLTLDAARVRAGDVVLLSGPIADHGITILLTRGELDLDAPALQSDSRSVYPLTAALADVAPTSLKWMRDPTRGGLSSALNELAQDAGLQVQLEEDAIPVRSEVRGACEVLGLDPLHVANEGQFVAVVAPGGADAALAALRATPGGEGATRIGVIREGPPLLTCRTPYGSERVVDMLVGDPLPRIC